MIGYIYQITNTINNKRYIGQTTNFKIRVGCHKSLLKMNKHGNFLLQKSFNKYGNDAFSFTLLLICEREELDYYEQSLIDILKPEYNLVITDVTSPSKDYLAKDWNVSLISPNNEFFPDIHNLSEFCRLHNLCWTSMYYLAKGIRKQAKGWTLLEPVIDIDTLPEGIEIEYGDILFYH